MVDGTCLLYKKFPPVSPSTRHSFCLMEKSPTVYVCEVVHEGGILSQSSLLIDIWSIGIYWCLRWSDCLCVDPACKAPSRPTQLLSWCKHWLNNTCALTYQLPSHKLSSATDPFLPLTAYALLYLLVFPAPLSLQHLVEPSVSSRIGAL